MHWYREGHRQRSRILYVFRTPGGVRVGRNALEPEVLRQIELHHPDIAFDWGIVRESQQVIESMIEPRRRRPAREGGDAAPAAVDPPAAPSVTPAVTPEPPPRPPSIPSILQGATPSEQVAFLAHWYPLVRERIELRTSDPARREALLALAERLNAGTWTDADQMTTGLHQAAEALERLSHVFAKRRRRPRRRSETRTPDSADPAAES
jgi:hypothetical protein